MEPTDPNNYESHYKIAMNLIRDWVGCTVQYSTGTGGTVQYSTVQGTVQYSTVQYKGEERLVSHQRPLLNHMDHEYHQLAQCGRGHSVMNIIRQVKQKKRTMKNDSGRQYTQVHSLSIKCLVYTLQ